MLELKKKLYPSDIKAKHPINGGICIDEDTIILTGTIPPGINSMDLLAAHPANPSTSLGA